MMQKVIAVHRNDPNGNPAGGRSTGTGILIDWQDGPLGRHAGQCTPGVVSGTGEKSGGCVEGCTRKPQNGAFVEGVIDAAINRLEYYQASKFDCLENQIAISNLRSALAVLNLRTQIREIKGVEGTHHA